MYMSEYGVKMYSQVKKHNTLPQYYDEMLGHILIPLDTYNSSPEIQHDVEMLLREPHLSCERGEYNWALELFKNPNHKTDASEPECYVVLRDVKSYN